MVMIGASVLGLAWKDVECIWLQFHEFVNLVSAIM